MQIFFSPVISGTVINFLSPHIVIEIMFAEFFYEMRRKKPL
jgi:hypothetical protein